MSYDWNFAEIATQETFDVLLRGFGTTVFISVTSIVFGSVIGYFWGTRASIGNQKSGLWQDPLSPPQTFTKHFFLRLTRIIFGTSIDTVRAIPLLLFIFLVYYGLKPFADVTINPLLKSLNLNAWVPSAVACAIVALTINLAAFVADLIRVGFETYPNRKIENGRAVGISDKYFLKKVVIPDVFREIFPGLANLYVTIFKMSTLASSIAVYEILHSGNLLIQRSYRPLETYTIIALFFILSIAVIVGLQRVIQTRFWFRKRV